MFHCRHSCLYSAGENSSFSHQLLDSISSCGGYSGGVVGDALQCHLRGEILCWVFGSLMCVSRGWIRAGCLDLFFVIFGIHLMSSPPLPPSSTSASSVLTGGAKFQESTFYDCPILQQVLGHHRPLQLPHQDEWQESSLPHHHRLDLLGINLVPGHRLVETDCWRCLLVSSCLLLSCHWSLMFISWLQTKSEWHWPIKVELAI